MKLRSPRHLRIGDVIAMPHHGEVVVFGVQRHPHAGRLVQCRSSRGARFSLTAVCPSIGSILRRGEIAIAALAWRDKAAEASAEWSRARSDRVREIHGAYFRRYRARYTRFLALAGRIGGVA